MHVHDAQREVRAVYLVATTAKMPEAMALGGWLGLVSCVVSHYEKANQ